MTSALGLLREMVAGALAGVALERALERNRILDCCFEQYGHAAEIEQFIAAETMRAHPGLQECLAAEIQRLPVRAGGAPAKMMTRRLGGQDLLIPAVAWPAQSVELLPLRDREIERHSGWADSPHVRVQRSLGRTIQDNVCYRAASLRASPGAVTIEGGLTTFGSALAAQEGLEWELLDQAAQFLLADATAAGPQQPDFGQLGERLAARRAIAGRSPDYLLDGTGRSNALAIATLVVHPSDDGYRAMFALRSGRTGAHSYLFHVIPAGMFQPEFGNVPGEWDIFHGMLKEYLEEICGVELSAAAAVRAGDSRYFYAHPQARSLRAAIAAGGAEFVVTGVVINLYTLRPEICTLLLVKDPSWWRAHQPAITGNWEYAPTAELSRLPGHGLAGAGWPSLRLDAAESEFLQYFGATPGRWVPPGLAALWLGVDAARARL
jgi:hypothetical protein